MATAAGALSSVFVSLFLLATSGQLTVLAAYALGQYAAIGLFSAAAAAWLPRTGPRALYRVGLLCIAGFYGLLLFFGKESAAIALPMGLLLGTAAGAFWFGVNALAYDLTDVTDRATYYGFDQALGSAVGVVMPLLSGLIITRIGGETGYAAVFAAALALYAVSTWLSGRMPEGPPVGGLSVWDAVMLPAARPRWRRMWVATALSGVRDGVMAVSGVGLVYIVARSPASLGMYAGVTALAGVAAALAVRRVRERARKTAMWLGSFGLAGGAALLLLPLSFPLLLASGLVQSAANPVLNVPVSSVNLDLMDEDPEAITGRGTYILSSEIAVNLGRVGAVLVFLALAAHVSPVPLLIASTLAAGLLQVAGAWELMPVSMPQPSLDDRAFAEEGRASS